MSLELSPTDLGPIAAARAEEAQIVAERVRDMLRRCRLLEDALTETRAGLLIDHYIFDVRYLIGAIQTLVAERADLTSDLASAVDEANEYLKALRIAEEDVVQLTADLERARRG